MENNTTYEQLIAPLEEPMIRTIWRIVRDAEDAQDTLQEVLALIWKRWRRITQHPNPRALILKICIDASYDYLRKRNRHQSDEDPDSLKQMADTSHTNAGETLMGRETEAEIMKAISRLPKKQAVAVLMRIVRDESYQAISQALGCSESTVRIHVSRGRAKLSQWLAHLNPSVKPEVS